MTNNQHIDGKKLPVTDLAYILGTKHLRSTTGRLPLAELARISFASIAPACQLLYQWGGPRHWPRLLREGFTPVTHWMIQASNTAIFDRWLESGAKIGFLCSFPRSGNTWMRFMLSDIVLQLQGLETGTELPVDPDDLIPVYCRSSAARRIGRCPSWAYEPKLAFIKDHAPFCRLERFFSSPTQVNGRKGVSKDSKVIYLFRSPEDSLVSLYNLRFRDEYTRSRARHTLDEFCRAELQGWIENVTSYLQAADEGYPVMFISYEQMLEQPGAVLSGLLQWLEVKHDRSMVERAVSNMRFCNLHALERKANQTPFPPDENALFFRKGRAGSGRSDLREETLQEIHRRTNAILIDAKQRELSVMSPGSPSDMKAAGPNGNGSGILGQSANREASVIAPRLSPNLQ